MTFYSSCEKVSPGLLTTSCIYRPNRDFSDEGIPSDGMRDSNGR